MIACDKGNFAKCLKVRYYGANATSNHMTPDPFTAFGFKCNLRFSFEALKEQERPWGIPLDLYLFRLSMKETTNLFALSDSSGNRLTREDWLRSFFSLRRDFKHSNNDFVFMPETDVGGDKARALIFGWIARETHQLERTGPNDGLEPTMHSGWQAAFFALDPSDHSDGQKVAFESLQTIGFPNSVMTSLVRAMNSQENAPYHTEINPIIEEGAFWKFAADHGERIKSVTFDVAAPNMFNDANDFQNELRSLKKNENVSHIKTTLESETSINHQTERMKDIIDYTERGAGTLSATATDGEKYHSDKHAKHIDIKVDHHSKGIPEFLRQVANWLDRIFG